jgi:hypothetical protein
MMTLADLRARNALPSWQEAVAVVQELLHATVAARGSAVRLPDVEHIALNDNGTVALLPGSSVPEHPVRHLAVMLELLLEDVPTPEPLLAIVERNRGAVPQYSTPEEFSQAVAFFERPGRQEDIARLVARAAAAPEQTRADEELKRLKARAMASEETVHQPAAPTEPQRSRAPLVAAVAAAIGVLAAAYVWEHRADAPSPRPEQVAQVTAGGGDVAAAPAADRRQAVTGPTDGSTGPAATAAAAPDKSLLSRVTGALRSAVNSVMRTQAAPPPKPAAAAAPPENPAKPARATGRQRSRHAGAAEPTDAVSSALVQDARKPDTQSRPETTIESRRFPVDPAAGVSPASITTAADGDRMYSGADADVWPPVVSRPVIADPPPLDAPADRVAVYDLVVSPAGVVEQVHIVSVPSSFHDRMILAHLKAWTFEPATRHGQPVRYRIRVRLAV